MSRTDVKVKSDEELILDAQHQYPFDQAELGDAVADDLFYQNLPDGDDA